MGTYLEELAEGSAADLSSFGLTEPPVPEDCFGKQWYYSNGWLGIQRIHKFH